MQNFGQREKKTERPYRLIIGMLKRQTGNSTSNSVFVVKCFAACDAHANSYCTFFCLQETK